MPQAPIIDIIGGPTASGKSALALERAAEFDGVIINADSMQIYDALPLLSAQPGAVDRAAAPHRLYGFLAPNEVCSATQWRALAFKEIERALEAGKRPVIVGGTGFYIAALLYGLSPIPDVAPEIRADAMAFLHERGSHAIHDILRDQDPVMAARLHPNDSQRLVRAWEVLLATGQSLSVWQNAPRETPPGHWRFHVTLALPERERLRARCDTRFDWMMDHGALAEVRDFAARIDAGAVPESAPITHALGFHPLRAHLRGQLDLEEAVARAKAETRQYAKRQVTWFRHQITPAPYISDLRIETRP